MLSLELYALSKHCDCMALKCKNGNRLRNLSGTTLTGTAAMLAAPWSLGAPQHRPLFSGVHAKRRSGTNACKQEFLYVLKIVQIGTKRVVAGIGDAFAAFSAGTSKKIVLAPTPMRSLAACAIVFSCHLVGAIQCGDNDIGCLERGCSAFCSKWTCKNPACPGCGPEIGCPAHPPSPPPPPPLPSAPPWDRGIGKGELRVYSVGAKLFANGLPLHIKGANWFGSEGRSGPPLGLDKHNIAWYMQFLKSNGFNAIRLLFNHDNVLKNPTLEPPNEAVYGRGAPWEAPELAHYKYIDMFVKLAQVAGEYGVLVMMARPLPSNDTTPMASAPPKYHPNTHA